MPLCSDVLSDGSYHEPREKALRRRYIQTNSTNLIRWLWFDVDREDAWFQPERSRLPLPTMTVINPKTGHAHIGYELEAPVSISSNSHSEPIEFMLAVQRGFTNRLKADVGYSHTLAQNGTHSAFATDWQGATPYTLPRLNDYLDAKDKRCRAKESQAGLGRNCTLFEQLRQIAYRHVLKFKKSGATEDDFRKFLEGAGLVANHSFEKPLMAAEVRGIAKSVSKWTWARFTLEKFSAIQGARAKRRWAKWKPRIRPAP